MRGTDQYPMTISHFYDMLVNYRNPRSTFHFDHQDHRVSFYTEEDGNEDDTDNRAHQVVMDKEEVMVTVMGEVAEAKGNMAKGPVLMFMSMRRQLSLVDMRCRPQLILVMMLLHTCHILHVSCP